MRLEPKWLRSVGVVGVVVVVVVVAVVAVVVVCAVLCVCAVCCVLLCVVVCCCVLCVAVCCCLELLIQPLLLLLQRLPLPLQRHHATDADSPIQTEKIDEHQCAAVSDFFSVSCAATKPC